MQQQRPVNLDLLTMKFPVMAIVSILHRISGVIIFLSIPFFLWMLSASLASEAALVGLQDCLAQWWVKWILWGVLTAVLYHVVAGVRHIIMDFGWGESLAAGKSSAIVVLVVAVIASLLVGVWLW